jgi:hypothetical protein
MSQPNALAQTADFEFAALNEAKNYRRALLRDFESYLRGNVLEVGAGIGQITSELLRIPEIKSCLQLSRTQIFAPNCVPGFPNTMRIREPSKIFSPKRIGIPS